MISIHDARLRWLGPIGLFLFGNLFFRLSFWLEATGPAKLHSILIGLLAGFAFWNLNRLITEWVQRRYPGLDQTRRRLLLLLLVSPVMVNAAVLSRYGLHLLLGSRPTWWLGLVDYLTSMGIQLFYFMVYISIYEGRYVLAQWQQTYQEKEQLLKAHWQTRFSMLKSQVNPHFLFNSLNALSALIEESPSQAGRFVDELSKMYRYLLQANDHELVQLSMELTFVESYVHLLQTRHGKGVVVQQVIPEQYLTRSLPPLTLQLLIENAVKHNVVQTNRPLCIEIDTTTTGQLRVSNNRQRKNTRNISNGVGLANIAAKYRMLTPDNVVIRDEDDCFTVLLPLLA